MLYDRLVKSTEDDLKMSLIRIEKKSKFFKAVTRKLPPYFPHSLDDFENLDGYSFFWNCYVDEVSLYIIMPWIPKKFDEICLLLELFGWEFESERKETNGYPEYYRYYRHPAVPKVKVTVNMESEKEQSTCELVVDRIELVEKPVYKVQCSDSTDI